MRLGRITDETIRDDKWAHQQYEIAYEYYFAGDWLSAEPLLREAIEVCPFDSRYRLLLSQVYCARGWLSMSFSVLESLKNFDPNNAGAHALEQLLRAKMRERKAIAHKARAKQSAGRTTIFGLSLPWFTKSDEPSRS